MKILAAVEVRRDASPLTGVWETVDFEGERHLLYSTLDDGQSILLRLDPANIIGLAEVFGLAVKEHYRGLLRLSEGVLLR